MTSSTYVADILDEIALEGLDGITLEALWKRLSVRPNFSLTIDEDTKAFIWKVIVSLEDILFYKLPLARPPLIYYDTLNQTTGDLKQAIAELDALYPYQKIPNLLGSCATFDSRTDVTAEVITLTYQSVCQQWDSSLVIVASQEARIFSLLGDRITPNLDFPAPHIQFTILERVGRARYQGVPSYGPGSIQTVVDDSKAIFHYLKFLIKHNMVKKQSQVGSLTPSLTVGHSMFYLTRFVSEQPMEFQGILETAIEVLKARPGNVIPYDEFYALFDSSKRKRVYKFSKSKAFKKYIAGNLMLPFRQIYPTASKSEWERKSKSGERVVRCFQLIDPKTDVGDIVSLHSKEKEKERDKDEDVTDCDFSSSAFQTEGVYYMNLPLYSQAYQHIKDAGSRGLTEQELEGRTGMDKVFARGMIKRLLKEKSVTWYMESHGRQRSKRYIVGENKQKIEAVSEIEQLLSDSKMDSSITFEESSSNIPLETSDAQGSETASGQQSSPHPKPKLDDENVSYRMLKRIGIIMKAIKQHRYRKFYQLHQLVVEEETKEGLIGRMDRLTLKKILNKLFADNCIKILNFTGNFGGDVKNIKLYADPTYFPDEDITSVLMAGESCPAMPPLPPPQLTAAPTDDDPHDPLEFNLEEILSLCLVENQIRMKYMARDVITGLPSGLGHAKKYSEIAYSPKFTRLNLLHDLLYYIVYGYSGNSAAKQEDMVGELSSLVDIDDDLRASMAQVYNVQMLPYMFVPPLTQRHSRAPGWCLLSDLLLRMPLSIFVKVARVLEPTDDLIEHLSHPIRKHFLIQDLPLSVRQCLLNRRNYLSSITDDIKRLAYIGLLQFGPRCGKDKYQHFLYLNRRTVLLDTTITPAQYYQIAPGLDYQKKEYEFQSLSDVQRYWMDMFHICLETNLGVKASMIGKEIPAEREFAKELLKPCLEPRSLQEVAERDDGQVPGDRLGAAGLDSVMFAFLRSNWMGTKKRSGPKPRSELCMMPASRAKQAARPAQPATPKASPPKWREVKARNSGKKREVKRKRTNYDQADIEALKLMSSLRVTWSAAEDNFLLICRAAMNYLAPNSRKFVRIPWVETRKLLQEFVPESKDKTQRAVARRVVYMMKNPTTARSVELCVEEVRQLPEAKQRFACTELLNSILPSSPDLPKLQGQLFAKFRELTLFMKDRFMQGNNLKLCAGNSDLIPDTMEEFKMKFQLEEGSPPSTDITVKEIRESVMRGMLMSTISCRADKTSSALQLFEIYRQYDEDELRMMLSRLNKDKVITLNKAAGGMSGVKGAKFLPLTNSPYRLSFAFQHLLNVKYRHEIYSTCYEQVQNLLVTETDGVFDVDLNECNYAFFTLSSAGLVSFLLYLPEEIIVLDKDGFKDSKQYSRTLERYCEMLKFSQSSSKFVCTPGKIIGITMGEETEKVGGKRKKDSENERSAKKGKRKEEEDIEDEDDGVVMEDRRDLLFVLREEATKEMNSSNSSATWWRSQELFVVSASKVSCMINTDDLVEACHHLEPQNVSKFIKDYMNESIVGPSLMNETKVIAAFAREHDPFEVRIFTNVLETIMDKREAGATSRDLLRLGSSEVVSAAVDFLVLNKMVIRAGIMASRYVAQKHSHPWLLSSFRMRRLDREKIQPNRTTTADFMVLGEVEVKKSKKGVITMGEASGFPRPSCSTEERNKVLVLIRPWIRIDGTLNRKVLDRLLGSILGHVMERPGGSMRVAMQRFAPSLLPIWTRNLIDILIKIGSIETTVINVKSKSGLFDSTRIDLAGDYHGIGEEELVLLEPSLHAVSCLGLFIGQKSYSKDFLLDTE